MKKNDVLTFQVDDVGFNGEGIVHFDGATVFVPFALFGETITAKILKVKGNVAFAKLETVVTASSFRVSPKCEVFGKCGGCAMQHIDYEKQLEIKQKTVNDCLRKIAFLDCFVDKVIASPKIYAYRNKLQLPIRHTEKGNVVGFFRENSHNVVPINHCPLHDKWADKLINAISVFIERENISCYDEWTNSGLLKHIVARFVNGSVLIALVSSSAKIPAIEKFVEILKTQFEKFSLIVNVNSLDTNVIFGEKFTTVFGDGKISLNEFGIDYEIGIQSFLQVNDEQKQTMYNKVIDFVCDDLNSVAIDGYSGAGVLTAMLAKRSKMAFGVEIVREAVESADKLKMTNSLQNKMTNILGDCAVELPKIIEKCRAENKLTNLVLDPPRKGVALSVLQAIKQAKPNKIAYISCSPQSLAKDLGIIMDTLSIDDSQRISKNANPSPDYQIVSVTPLDLFPHTKHVECVALLCLRENENKKI